MQDKKKFSNSELYLADTIKLSVITTFLLRHECNYCKQTEPRQRRLAASLWPLRCIFTLWSNRVTFCGKCSGGANRAQVSLRVSLNSRWWTE